MKIRVRKNLFLSFLFTLFLAFVCLAAGEKPLSAQAADNCVKELGSFTVDGYTGLLIETDNTDGEAFDFTVRAEGGEKHSVAENTGSVLLLPEGAPAFWAEQTIPADFKGEMFLPFSAKTVGQWNYLRYNKVFSNALEGEMSFSAESDKENVAAFLSASLVEETQESVLTAKTSLPGTLFETGGKYADAISPLLKEEAQDGLLIKGATENAWMRVHNVGLTSTNGTYGVAVRIKNPTSDVLRMQVYLMDQGAVEYTTSRWYDYTTDGFYLTFLHTDGSASKVYNKENFTPNSSTGSYLHIPANADGVLIMPWNMFLNYCGYYTFTGFQPSKGAINGKIDSVHHLRFQLKNSKKMQAWENGYYLGSVYSVNMDGSMNALTNPASTYANDVSVYGKGGVHSETVVVGQVADMAKIVMPQTEGILATAGGYTVYGESYAFLGDEISFNAQYGYTLNGISLNGTPLSNNADGFPSYKITAADIGNTLVFEADMEASAYSLGSFDVTDKTGLLFSVNNENGAQFDFTVKAVNGDTVRTANGAGSVLLIPENEMPYWSAQTIPADFKGKVYLPFSVAESVSAGYRSNPVFDGAIEGTAEFTVYVEKALDGTSFTADGAVDASQEKALLAQTTFAPALFEKNGVYYEGITAANAEYKKEGVKIQGKFPKANQWVKLRGMNMQTTDGSLGLAIRMTNLSAEKLPFKLFAVTFNNVEVGTQREIGYDNEWFYLLFVHTDGSVEKLYYESNGYFYLPANGEGTVVLPWNMMLGYQGTVTDADKTGTDNGRIDSVYLLRFLHGKDISSDKTWNDGFIVGSIYTVNTDGSMTKVYNSADRFSAFLFSQAKGEKFTAVDLELQEDYEGATKLTSSSSKYYVGDTFTVTANVGYALQGVEVNGVALSGTDGVYTYTIADIDVKILLKVTLVERMANVIIEADTSEGFTVSQTGKIAAGGVVTIFANVGFSVTEVKVNGNALTAENGVYSYTVQDEDINTELKFTVVVKVTTANVLFTCDRLGGAQITAIGPLDVGTVITVRQNDGFTVLKVECNGVELTGENGVYSYTIQASDVGTDVHFVVEAIKGAPQVDSPATDTEEPKKSGCGSVAVSACSLAFLAASIALLLKKKSENA